jgi:hypothetical protein
MIKKTLTTAQTTAVSLTRTVIRSQHATLGLVGNLSMIVRSPNTPAARDRQLRAAIKDLEQAVDSRTISAANDATKRALEAIHELADCASRGEWSQASWTPDELGLWRAHVGARNASHHTSSNVVALHADADSATQQLCWDFDPAAISRLHSRAQQTEFNARLAGQEVIAPLRSIASKVASSI